MRDRQIYNITDFGAVGDGEKLNTQYIQQAIDACAWLEAGPCSFSKRFSEVAYHPQSVGIEELCLFFEESPASLEDYCVLQWGKEIKRQKIF